MSWVVYVKSYVLGSSGNTEGERGCERSKKNTTSTEPKQTRSFTGTVTSVNEYNGMIDAKVFFSFSCIIGDSNPVVGDPVHVAASRDHSQAGWTATRVEILNAIWKQDNLSHTEVLVGVVAHLTSKLGVIDCSSKEVSFPVEKATTACGTKYRPSVKDCVQVCLLHQDDETVVNEVRPLREESIVGRVSFVCERGYCPTVGDEVKCSCVEYNDARSNWRAFSVEPIAEIKSENREFTVPLPKIPIRGKKIDLIQLLSPQGTTTNSPAVQSKCDPSSSSLLADKGTTSQVTSILPISKRRYVRRRHWNGAYQSKLLACRVPGERPLRQHPLKLPHQLRMYPIPQHMREYFEERRCVDLMALEPSLGEPLCKENYCDRFSALLHIEEIQMEVDIRQFDMTDARLSPCGPYLSLSVTGLAEGRPSLLVGDKVIVCEEGGDEASLHWEGYIHEIRGQDILIKFAESFHQTFSNQDLDVMFTFTRTPLRRMHHVVEMSTIIGAETLFPCQPSGKPPLLNLSTTMGGCEFAGSVWFNPSLNSRQKCAVSRILGGQCRPAPYILFGPPGTGKTVTMVEAILQVNNLSSRSRILACAPSNSAVDLLAERLIRNSKLKPRQLVRLNAVQRRQHPSARVEPYCMNTDQIDMASRCCIIVATCATAGMLHSLKLAVGHFSHVFVDEAGQATEPECLLPLALLAETDGQVILAGDPYQLGPILSSKLAGEHGMQLSMLERIMSRKAYQRNESKFSDHGCYDPLLVTKLVENYRSHAHLLSLYSELFYHNELLPKSTINVTHTMVKWEGLPRKGFPLVFHGVQGEDMQEGNSPSWFNPVEAVQVVKYIQALKDNTTYAPKLSDIGVITPYRKQVEKIRFLLNTVGIQDVKIGSVEEFQGQERMVIIISTVRSSDCQIGFDLKHHIGFLSNPKRFNVAISRAQALLIVIGNPILLANDPHWCKLVDYAVSNGAYTGCQKAT